MSRRTRHKSRTDAAWMIAALAVVLVAAAAAGVPASAQLIDSTLEDVLNDDIDAQVEEQLDEMVEESIEEQVESDVAESVEQQVESEVVDSVEQQIEADVAATIDQAVESGVTETIEQEVEATVTETLEQQIEAAIDQTLDGDLETLGSGLRGAVEDGLEDVVERVGEAVEGTGEAGERADDAQAGGQDAQPAAAFAGGIDADGREIERDVWVVLVPAEHVTRIQGWGFTVREQQNLPALERVLLRVDAPGDRDIVQAALELALDAPGTLVDFNHVYEPGAEDEAPAETATHAGLVRASSAVRAPATLSVGIVDSAVAAEHEALRAADIVQKEFVPFNNTRPSRHGTAVASIFVGHTGMLAGHSGARLYAASVFFSDAAGRPGATTASLVEGLAWLAAERVHVVNMSLAGPPNRVLEAALERVTALGVLVVAAVGNNGPAGEPLYPAAYDEVIGVTAVDAAHRIYRYANRGPHVAFAAPGVRIRVAVSDGGYRTESGTSMAAPYASAIIARSIAADPAASSANVLKSLQATAIDLGAQDFDEVFGYGLIAAAEPAAPKSPR